MLGCDHSSSYIFHKNGKSLFNLGLDQITIFLRHLLYTLNEQSLTWSLNSCLGLQIRDQEDPSNSLIDQSDPDELEKLEKRVGELREVFISYSMYSYLKYYSCGTCSCEHFFSSGLKNRKL